MDVIEAEVIVVLPRKHFPPSLVRHSLTIIFHHKNDMTAILPPRDSDVSTALHTLNAVLYRILNEWLKD